MNHPSTDSPRSNTSIRCRHRTFEGRRCRLNASDPAIGLCNKHVADRDQRIEDADIILSLTGDLSCFSDPQRINVFLSRLLLLLAQGRISPRQAGVMAYISSLHLRTLEAIERNNLRDANAPARLILDGPRPNRDDAPKVS